MPSSSKPAVSIIVPMRNEAGQARACLESLAAIAYEPLQVIVVDDRSTDDTVSVCQAWLAARTDARFSVLRAPQEPPQGWVGKAFATDFGIRASTGDLVLIADADVRHAVGSLEESVGLLGKRSMLVRLPWVPLRHAGSALSDFLLFTIWGASRFALAARGLPLSFGAYVLMRRSFYEEVGGFAAHRSFPESLPLARAAAARSSYRLAHPAPAVRAELYESFAAAARGALRNINFGLVSYPALLAAFVLIGWPLWMLGFLGPLTGGGLALWCAGLFLYERACGRSWGAALLLALLGPLSGCALAFISCAALVRRALGLSVEWRGRSMRVQ